MGTRDTYHRTLVRACALAGDETALARALRVPLPAMVDWLLGHQPVPDDVFLRAVDFVLTHHKEQTRAVKELLDQIRRRHQR